MFDLFFTNDAIEGARFCLTLLREKLPSRLAFVHLYDINTREFVTVGTDGEGAEAQLLGRYGESDPLFAAATKKRRALVVNGLVPEVARFAAATSVKSIVVAPVMDGGRFLGAIELVNPVDDMPFTDREGHAVTYVCERFAEFVAARGVVVDPEKVSLRRVG
jgi:hypothetical protein